MADSPPDPDSKRDTGTGQRPNRGTAPGAPRWVKVFGIIVTVAIVVFVIVHLAGGGLGNH